MSDDEFLIHFSGDAAIETEEFVEETFKDYPEAKPLYVLIKIYLA
jgi:DNA polymerase sigma